MNERCNLEKKFPNSLHITHPSSHWSNKKIVLDNLHKAIFLFVEQKRKELNFNQHAKALLFFDIFKGQTTPAVTDLLHKYNCIVIHVPNNYTNLFQLLYISIKKAKCFLADKYWQWCANEALKLRTRGVEPNDVKVDVRLINIKPSHTNWLTQAYYYLPFST